MQPETYSSNEKCEKTSPDPHRGMSVATPPSVVRGTARNTEYQEGIQAPNSLHRSWVARLSCRHRTVGTLKMRCKMAAFLFLIFRSCVKRDLAFHDTKRHETRGRGDQGEKTREKTPAQIMQSVVLPAFLSELRDFSWMSATEIPNSETIGKKSNVECLGFGARPKWRRAFCGGGSFHHRRPKQRESALSEKSSGHASRKLRPRSLISRLVS